MPVADQDAHRVKAARIRELSGMEVNFRAEVWPEPTLSEASASHLYRIAQEALTNVARHSQASRVDISVSAKPGTPPAERSIVARIADNGTSTKADDSSSGLGLIGMRERVEALGGTLELSQPPHSGFVVLARIPVQGLA